MTPVEFLRARLDEDQRAALDWQESYSPQHPSLVDPARVLAEVDAKRRIVELWERENGERHLHAEGEARAWLMDEVLQALALPYAEHPDYDPAWRV